ncbi:MAG: hypothetical protein AABZ60_08135 [Planctomycetota bacterium]
MARAPVKKNRSHSKSSSSVPLPAILAGGGVLLLILFFLFFSSSSKNDSSSESTEIEETPAELSLKMSLETLQEKVDLELTKLGNTLGALEKVLELGSDLNRRQKDFQNTSVSQKYFALSQKIQGKIDQIAEQEYLKLQAEEQSLIEQYQWAQAKNIWIKYPERLKVSILWYAKALEAPKLFSKKMEDRFLRDVQELNRLLEEKNSSGAKKIREQLLIYATEEQKQELEPIWTQLRHLENNSSSQENPPVNQKQPIREEEDPPPDPDSEPSSSSKNSAEKKAEALFLEAESHFQKQEYGEAQKKLKTLQDQYGETKFVSSVHSVIREMYQQSTIANAPEKDKFVARLQAFFKGNVSQIKGEKNTFQIEYNFLSEAQMEDFETKREDGLLNEWTIQKEGLFGTSQHALYWKPNLVGDVQVEATFRPSKIDNVGICILASSYHRRYVFYPSLRDKWANWAGGDGVIVSTKEERYQSVKLGAKEVGLAHYEQNIEDASQAIYMKIQRKSQKNNTDLLLWASKKAISPKDKPQVEGKDNELDNGQVVLLGASGTLFTRLVIVCTFDPGWLRQFR